MNGSGVPFVQTYSLGESQLRKEQLREEIKSSWVGLIKIGRTREDIPGCCKLYFRIGHVVFLTLFIDVKRIRILLDSRESNNISSPDYGYGQPNRGCRY